MDAGALAERVLEARRRVPARRAVLAAITGIDGSGKGHVAARVEDALRSAGVRVAVLGVDGWLNLPHRRFDADDPAGHFYRHAIRFDEMFERLVFPLRDRRSLRIVADHTDETATGYRPRVHAFERVDVVVLEGIFLLKREFQSSYDLSCWIDCGFETALRRAVARAQEGLSPEQTMRAYRTIYFPAQMIHFRRDRPRTAATMRLNNDPALREPARPGAH